jgi:DNA primase catalytic subunit
MAVFAIKVMDQGLREDFGFKHVAWFYSGRRGVHCWVADEQARQLSNEGRSAIADYFQVLHLVLLAPSMGEISHMWLSNNLLKFDFSYIRFHTARKTTTTLVI